MAATYTQAEVDKHNTKGDTWMIIHEKVYDVSTFAEDHPGGEEAIYDEAGKDATESFEDIGHSDEARELLQKFYIGELDTTSPGAVKPTPVPVTRIPEEKPKGSVLRVLIPAVVVAGILLYKYVIAPQQKH
ncbi:cytochrome b5 [Mucor mucedo]|uniref:cytochrome b5 n=1 Tax=Mucor mucedo TaxID=29922 RepID=UPI002220138D|nr:cytochrome b5 [Mucor mucedo]KAI7896224.1 cytochrome b5 [Mucor mucedo]